MLMHKKKYTDNQWYPIPDQDRSYLWNIEESKGKNTQ